MHFYFLVVVSKFYKGVDILPVAKGVHIISYE